MYEFRVLTGCHKSAVAPVNDGDTLGRTRDCTLILADEGAPDKSVTISINDQHGWSIDNSDTLQFNVPARFGELWVTVATPNQDWPSVETIGESEGSDSQENNSEQEAIANLAVESESEVEAELASDHAYEPVEKQPGFTLKHRKKFIALGLLVLIFTVALLVWLHVFSGTESGLEHSEEAPQQSSAAEVKALLAELAIGNGVTFNDEDGAVVLKGWVENTSDLEKLAAVMTKVWPMPRMQVLVQSEVLKSVNATLEQENAFLRADAAEKSIRIYGIAQNLEQVGKLALQISHIYADIDVIYGDVVSAQSVIDAVEVGMAGLVASEVPVLWSPPYLELDISMVPNAEKQAVRKLVDELNKTYWNAIRAGDSLNSTNNLPFVIRSIVSGDSPYLVLDDGSRLLVGGLYKGVRLLDINNDSLVFFHEKKIVVDR